MRGLTWPAGQYFHEDDSTGVSPQAAASGLGVRESSASASAGVLQALERRGRQRSLPQISGRRTFSVR